MNRFQLCEYIYCAIDSQLVEVLIFLNTDIEKFDIFNAQEITDDILIEEYPDLIDMITIEDTDAKIYKANGVLIVTTTCVFMARPVIDSYDHNGIYIITEISEDSERYDMELLALCEDDYGLNDYLYDDDDYIDYDDDDDYIDYDDDDYNEVELDMYDRDYYD